MGVAEPPDTGPIQLMTDALRGLTVGEPPREHVIATARAAADMMELQTDWMMDQHRLIKEQGRLIAIQNKAVAEAQALVRSLLGRRPE